MIDDKYVDEVTRAIALGLTENGLLIEAGWVAFAKFALPEGVSDVQRRDMRAAFFAGAQHLFGSMNTIMDHEDREPTMEDLHKMDMIAAELDNFVDQELNARIHQHGNG